jgi:uncharacterized membrane protein YbhN (UPF0104 family)
LEIIHVARRNLQVASRTALIAIAGRSGATNVAGAKRAADERQKEKKFRMENDHRIANVANVIGCDGSTSVGSVEPDAPPWTGSWLPLIAAWLFGALILVGLIVFIMHFGAIEVFMAIVRRANPIWIAAAVACQIATYFCAALVWFIVLKTGGSFLAFRSLLRLALVELFANQAVPTGGLSGSLMVMHGLTRRGVDAATAVTALLIATMSYYAAYVLAGSLAFILLWHSGDLSAAWRSLFAAFAVAAVILAVVLVILSRIGADFVPEMLSHWRPFAQLEKALSSIRLDLCRDPRLVFAGVGLQSCVFLLDTATLWCASRAVGMSIDAGGVFTSFVLASVVATLSPIPLGLGTFEGSCTGLLHLMGGGLEASLAATLILRGLTLWVPMLPGLWLISREKAPSPPDPLTRGDLR